MEDTYGDEVLKEIEYEGYKIRLIHDSEPCETPRDGDNLGTMVIIHSRYNLGDPSELNARQLLRICESKDVVALPIFMYDHSGITIRTIRFDCLWDSGQCGFIYVTKAKLREWYGYKNVSPKRAEWARTCLRSEVRMYDLYLTGQVYGYEVAGSNGDVVDSCWGFITDDTDSVIQQGKDSVDCMTA